MSYKVVIVGPAAVGKTTIIGYLKYGKYVPGMDSTIGASFYEYTVKVDGKDVVLSIWDTAGSPRYQSIMPMYLREADAVILTIDVSSSISLNDVKNYWLSFLDKEIQNIINSSQKIMTQEELINESQKESSVLVTKNVVKYFVANKCDLITDFNDVNVLQSQQTAQNNGYKYFITSAVTGSNIYDIFSELARELSEKRINLERINPDDLCLIEDVKMYANPSYCGNC